MSENIICCNSGAYHAKIIIVLNTFGRSYLEISCNKIKISSNNRNIKTCAFPKFKMASLSNSKIDMQHKLMIIHLIKVANKIFIVAKYIISYINPFMESHPISLIWEFEDNCANIE